MRGLWLLAPMLLAACHSEPSFDERFDKASQEVEARARAMDADVATADSAATVGGVGAKADRRDLPADRAAPKTATSSGE